MTAKEMLKKSILITDNVNGTGYFFTEPRLKDFLIQYSKEQRELCWRELNKKVYMDKDYTKQLTKTVILNTKQPEV